MAITKQSFDLYLEQRYFHFVAVEVSNAYNLDDYWHQIGETIVSMGQETAPGIGLKIQHSQVTSSKAYSRGNVLASISSTRNGKQFYTYDLFACETPVEEARYFVFAFPFAALAKAIVNRLIKEHDLHKNCNLQAVDVPGLVLHDDLSLTQDGFQTHITGLNLVTKGDDNISSIKLRGDNPLQADVYLDSLQDQVKFRPKMCVLDCILQLAAAETQGENVTKRRLRAKVHMDIFGNFKFYLHIGGVNFVLIAHLLKRLHTLNCLKKVSINPLERYDEEQS